MARNRPRRAEPPVPEPPPRPPARWPKVVIAALALLAGVLVWPQVASWSQRYWVERLGIEIDHADEASLPALVSLLAQHDEVGLAELTLLLVHSRAEVRQAAEDEIRGLLEKWKKDAPAAASLRVARLTHLLAQQSAEDEEFPLPHGLSQTLLNWPLETSAIDARQFLSDCEAIAMREPARPPRKEIPEPTRVARVMPLPIPDEPAPELVMAEPPPKRARLVDVDEGPDPLEDLRAPEMIEPDAPQSAVGRARPVPVVEPPTRIGKPGDVRPLSNWEALSDQEVMRDLHAGSDEEVQAAVAELRRRGYEPHHLPLARSLTHPDPAVRRDLAEALPRIRGIDWRRWIAPLLEDEDPAVRTAAASVQRAGGKR